MTRRDVLRAAAAAAFARPGCAATFQPTWESLKQYRCPEWFRDAKLGIWAHWGPQCAPRQGDWYARNMYIQGSRQYNYHVAHYGHPSKVGYKDVIPLWKAEHWEPETLIRRYRRAGARYFVSLGVHCDNFDCWNSRHHRWNAVNFGPRRDVVGTWRRIARDHGLRFGVSEHLAWSWTWFNVNKNHDTTGPLAGVPYDGNDPKYRDLYFPPHAGDYASYAQNPPESWKQEWLRRVKDLVDQHRPDLVYTDGGAFDGVGLELIAHYYNAGMKWHHGVLDGVYTLKNHTATTNKIGEYERGASTLDAERGLMSDIHPDPWQSDTCIGQWFYWEGFDYKTAGQVVHWFVDIVSKNGNLLLNFPLMPDGTLDSREESILEDFTAWTAIHGEGLFGTRPWKTYGEGPTAIPHGRFSELKMKPFTAEDVRFTSKGDKLYVFCMGVPERDIKVRALGRRAGLWPRKIAQIRMLGSGEPIRWRVEEDAVRIERPEGPPSKLTVAFEVS